MDKICQLSVNEEIVYARRQLGHIGVLSCERREEDETRLVGSCESKKNKGNKTKEESKRE